MQFGKSGKDDKDITAPIGTSVDSSTSGSGQGKLEAILGKGSKVVGNLTFTGPVELDGHVEGEINAQDRITIGESAVINARIIGGEVVVKGTVNGDINASKRLSLKRPAKVIGNISSTNLSIEEGVVFEGKCIMSSPNSASANLTQKGVVGVAGNAGKLGATAA